MKVLVLREKWKVELEKGLRRGDPNGKGEHGVVMRRVGENQYSFSKVTNSRFALTFWGKSGY